MLIYAYCFRCEKSVPVHPVLAESQFWKALEISGEVEVMHIEAGADHVWRLNREEKQNLLQRKQILEQGNDSVGIK